MNDLQLLINSRLTGDQVTHNTWAMYLYLYVSLLINSKPDVFLFNWLWMWVNNSRFECHRWWLILNVHLYFHQNCLNSYVVLHIPGRSFLFSLLKNPGCDSSSFTTTLLSSLTSSTSAVDCSSSIVSNGHVSCSKTFNNLSWK